MEFSNLAPVHFLRLTDKNINIIKFPDSTMNRKFKAMCEVSSVIALHAWNLKKDSACKIQSKYLL